jgi:ketosteroid isomerase-like protein
MDNAAVLALWEENGVSVLPNAPPLVGKPAIGESLERIALELPCTKMNLFTLDCTTVALEGDFASERCVEHRIIGFPDGKPPLESRSRVLHVLHRRAGRWRIRAEMRNEAEPRTAAR